MKSIGITGHRDLTPATQRHITALVSAALAEVGDTVNAVTCLATGADQLFALSVLAGGGTVTFISPYADVANDFAPGAELQLFEACLSAAIEVVALPFEERSNGAYLQAGLRVAEMSDEVFAIWDGQPSQGVGGTKDVVDYCELRQIPYQVFWPEGAARVRKMPP